MSMSADEARAVVWTGVLGLAKHLGKRAWHSVKHPLVIQLKDGAAETPMYFIGTGLSELHLAKLVRSERSIFGVHIPFASAWRDAAAKRQSYALPTMEELVAPYVAALSVHARSSPCVLVGHSFNGLIAFEAARQLNQQGGKVQMVILLDTELKYPTPHHVAWQILQKDWKQSFNLQSTDRSLRSVGSRLGSSWSTIRWMLVKEMKGLGHRFLATMVAAHAYCRQRRRQIRDFPEEVRWARWNLDVRDPRKLTTMFDEKGLPWQWGLLWRLYSNALTSYQARCLDCRGVLFRAGPENPADEPSIGTLRAWSLGWDDLFSGGLEMIQVTGNHITMMQQPHIATLAQEMNKVLDRSLCR
jgi:thioesterase domain-containing protein